MPRDYVSAPLDGHDNLEVGNSKAGKVLYANDLHKTNLLTIMNQRNSQHGVLLLVDELLEVCAQVQRFIVGITTSSPTIPCP